MTKILRTQIDWAGFPEAMASCRDSITEMAHGSYLPRAFRGCVSCVLFCFSSKGRCAAFVLKNLISCLSNCLVEKRWKRSKYALHGEAVGGFILSSLPVCFEHVLQQACTHVASSYKEQKTWTLSGLQRKSRLQVGCTSRALMVCMIGSLATGALGTATKDVLCSSGPPLWTSLAVAVQESE